MSAVQHAIYKKTFVPRNGVNVEKSKKIDIDLKFDFLDMDFLDEIDSDGNTGIAFTFKVQFFFRE